MTRIARIIAVAPLPLLVAMTSLAGSAAAQKQLFEVENSQGVKLLQVSDDASFVVQGYGAGTIPAEGDGARLMWYSTKAALRAGGVVGSAWDDANIGSYSMAFGLNTTASRVSATALGSGTTAGGEASTAMGSRTTASGETSTAFGRETRASGAFSTAMGYDATAGGTFSFALGTSAAATGGSSTAFGGSTTASADFATAMGNNSTASGNTSTAMGLRTIASGDFSTAMGGDTRASGVGATAMGSASTAAGLASVAMGTRAVAQGNGSFAFADRSSTETYTALDNQFVVRAHGGIGFNSGTNIGCDLAPNSGAWACASSRLAKEGFEDLDGESVLTKLAGLRIQRWNYIGNGAAHVGPFAEDFWAAFGLGEGSTTITTVDADGIALLGVQTLERRTVELRAENVELRAGHAELLRRFEALEAERTAATRASTRRSIP